MVKNVFRYFKSFFITDDMSPIPWKVVWVIFFLQLFMAMKMTMVFSFVPKMVKSFGVSEVNTGYYAGLLASAIYIGFVLFSLLWGHFGDIKGRKLAIIVNLVGLGISSLAFGFSYNYYWAVVTRLLQGCFFGGVVVCKSMLYQLLDDSNMALGMAVSVSSWTTGFIIGPSLSGLLVFPCEQYPETFHKDSIFARFPVLLPHLVSVSGLAITVVLGILYLPSDKKREINEYSPLLKKSSNATLTANGIQQQTKNDVGNDVLIERKITQSCTLISPAFYPDRKEKPISMFRIFRWKECLYSCMIYCGLCLQATANEELFPLFASTAPKFHGMGFSTAQIGVALLIASACVMIVQVSILSRVTKEIGPRKTFIWAALLCSFFMPLVPAMAFIKNRVGLWILLSLQMLISRVFIAGQFLVINIIINNSVPEDLVGAANGLGFSLSAMGRLVAPSCFGSMYSWSLTNIKGIDSNKHPLGFPFDQFFSFFILAICFILSGLAATRIPKSLDLKWKSEETDIPYEKIKLTNTL